MEQLHDVLHPYTLSHVKLKILSFLMVDDNVESAHFLLDLCFCVHVESIFVLVHIIHLNRGFLPDGLGDQLVTFSGLRLLLSFDPFDSEYLPAAASLVGLERNIPNLNVHFRLQLPLPLSVFCQIG